MDDISSFLQSWAAAERDGDMATLSTSLTEDFLGVGPLGFMLDKQAWVARFEAGDLEYRAFDLDEIHVRTHGEAALVTTRQDVTGTYQGHPLPEASRASLFLVSEIGAWQLAGIHLSFIAGTPGTPTLRP
jgi:ketosteroid isomerase-like protein